MAFHVAVVDPVVPAVGKLPDIVAVQLCIMRAVDVADYDIMSRAVILIVSAEIHIVERMCRIAADNGLVRLKIDIIVAAVIATAAV